MSYDFDEPKYRPCAECGHFEGHDMNCPYAEEPEEETDETEEV